ncbi:MAG: septum formation initiator family protein [Elusimicrobia bacterium]|nr:septum formation initiator family protein [Elusimicrobiota bacterium]MDE2237467.1 septum formation initiator family protein [Elusimicrobiota bacterium]MDE2424661.1 septum formation initiator family protein [Elusimicrobiota bacterium]
MSQAERARRAWAFLRTHGLGFAVALILLAVFFGNQGFRSLVRNYFELRGLDRRIALLQAEEKNSAESLRSLRSSDSSIERLARRELGYVRQGEIEYRFPPPGAKKPEK